QTYTDTVTVATADGTSQLVSVVITGTNDNPVAVNDTATTAINVPVTIDVLANDTDAEGDTVTITKIGATPVVEGDSVTVAHGSVQLSSGKLVFTPDTDYH